MSKSNEIGPEGRETIADPVTELLRVGAQQLIQQAVEADCCGSCLSSIGIAVPRRTTPEWYGSGYLPETRAADWFGSGNGANPEGPRQNGRRCDVPIGAGTALHSKDEVDGSGGAVVVFERRLERRNG